MFDVLIREAGARFGLGDKALPVAQMLLAYMTNRDTGGLAGFLEKFKAAGLGPIIQSWLGGGPSAQPVSNSQVETVLGGSGCTGGRGRASGRFGRGWRDRRSRRGGRRSTAAERGHRGITCSWCRHRCRCRRRGCRRHRRIRRRAALAAIRQPEQHRGGHHHPR